MADKKWSQMSPHELLDLAQEQYDTVARKIEKGTRWVNEPWEYRRAEILLAAAQVQATENLAWTLQNRTSIGSPEMPTGWTPTP